MRPHPYEKNWNARYRAGASPSNIGNNESSAPGWDGNAWTMSIDRPTKNHAVVGASIRSLRRDILYGTFESVLSPPKAGSGGTVLAMRLDYNESQTLNLNVMNADAPKDAWTSFMIYGDWRGERSKGVNFTDFGNSSYNFATSPWGFVPYRIDWTDKKADFFIGDALARSIKSHESPKEWPRTPSTLYIRHSSIGDAYTSEGPPPNGSYAQLGRIRAFFNSSMMTTAEHASFDARCRGLEASDNAPAANSSSTSRQCLVSDMSLRGSTTYSTTATTQFKQRSIDYTKRWPAIFMASTCIAISTILLLHALFKRAPWSKKKTEVPTEATADSARASKEYYVTPSMIFSERDGLALAAQFPGTGTPGAVTPGTQTPGHRSLRYSDFSPPWSEVEGPYFTRSVSSTSLAAPARSRPESGSLHIPPLPVGLSIQQRSRCEDITAILTAKDSNQPTANVRGSLDISPVEPNRQISAFVELIDEKKDPEVTVKEIDIPSAATESAKPAITPPKQRVDYLAGLVSLPILPFSDID
ncbi:hypothetical protein N0V83_010702 [Neocucurbitaria cava]|uniref:GH16 domain-containing protein n=1 Tax=Neocucurbitaria cava TaxID=798079 RepID=A0A9W8XZ90_9PLEO|nr:hypothetical protein N0V83_010702 [Neocucurbitaria cava]